MLIKSSSICIIITAVLIVGTIIWVGIDGAITSGSDYEQGITIKAGWGSQFSGNEAEAFNVLPTANLR